MKVVVIGAGIVGTATAYYLAHHGAQVEVVERRSAVAEETSHANGGVIHVSEVHPWAQPGMPRQILRWLGKEDAPLLLRYGAIPHMWRWGLEYVRNCTAEKAAAHSRTNLRLALLSQRSLHEIREAHNIAYEKRATGALKIFGDVGPLDAATRLAEEQAKDGVEFRRLDPQQCVELEPSLERTANSLAGGVFVPDEECGDPNVFTKELARVCAQMGVVFHYNTDATGLIRQNDIIGGVGTSKGDLNADAVVVAMGSFSPLLLRKAGVRIWIYPVRGVTVTVDGRAWDNRPKRPVIDEGRLFGLVPMGDRLRISGSAEISGYDPTPSAVRCKAIIRNVIERFPDFKRCYDPKTAVLWGGLRPVTPGGVPYVGRTSISNLYVNAGHCHFGWTTGCGSGRVVADMIMGRKLEIDVTGLTPATH